MFETLAKEPIPFLTTILIIIVSRSHTFTMASVTAFPYRGSSTYPAVRLSIPWKAAARDKENNRRGHKKKPKVKISNPVPSMSDILSVGSSWIETLDTRIRSPVCAFLITCKPHEAPISVVLFQAWGLNCLPSFFSTKSTLQ